MPYLRRLVPDLCHNVRQLPMTVVNMSHTYNRVRTEQTQSSNSNRTNADTSTNRGMSSARSASLLGIGSTEASTSEPLRDENRSAPHFVWTGRDQATDLTTGDKTTVAGVVSDKLFQRAKFVDRDNDLMYDEKDGSVCKFVTTSCNLQANIDISVWWKEARKWIPNNISRLRNDKNTAMKWAFLGK